MIDVSIIMPVWNGGATVDRAIISVIKLQFDGTIELVVINDGSNDNRRTLSKLEKWSRRISSTYEFPRLSYKLLNHLRNLGAASARNSGLKAASGNYICYLDCDDIYYTNRIITPLQLLEQFPNEEFVCNNYDLGVWDADYEVFVPKTVHEYVASISLFHKKSNSVKFIDNLISKEFEILLSSIHALKSSTKIGCCYVSPTGQGQTHRKPNSGLGITINQPAQ